MPLDQAEAQRLQNAKWGKATYPAPTTPIMIRLVTANGSASAPGTEVANAGGSAYAPQNASTATPASAPNGVMTSNAAITFTNMPAATVVGLEEWTSDPRRTTFGALAAPKTTALGDSLTIAAGQLTDTMT
ncbi:hypothetical protein [Pseudonocardia sp. NPDC049635]|uniref:phage tail fiber protein n=1 Tax=Pseudonocardia sp. NPDC049635 TaxID=3155506 RepID=UPI0033C9DC4A